MQPYQLVCVVLGAGLDSLLGLLSTVLPLQHRNHLVVVVLPLSTLGLVASQVVATWHRADSSNNTIVHDMARQVLEALPHAAVVLSTGDLNYYPLLYRQACLVSNLSPSLPPSLPPEATLAPSRALCHPLCLSVSTLCRPLSLPCCVALAVYRLLNITCCISLAV